MNLYLDNQANCFKLASTIKHFTLARITNYIIISVINPLIIDSDVCLGFINIEAILIDNFVVVDCILEVIYKLATLIQASTKATNNDFTIPYITNLGVYIFRLRALVALKILLLHKNKMSSAPCLRIKIYVYLGLFTILRIQSLSFFHKNFCLAHSCIMVSFIGQSFILNYKISLLISLMYCKQNLSFFHLL